MNLDLAFDYLLEDSLVDCLSGHLESNGWTINSFCKGRSKGIDISASKNGQILYVEVKGGRGNPELPGVVNAKFNSGQIRDHLGKGIVKLLELRTKNPEAILLLVHPKAQVIFDIVVPVAKNLKPVAIHFCFINSNGEVEFPISNPLRQKVDASFR